MVMINASRVQLVQQIEQLEQRVRKLSEEKANLYLILHMVELLSPIAGVESFLDSLMSALGSSLGGTNVEIYYLDEEQIHYANLFGERRIIEQLEDPLIEKVFKDHQFVENLSAASNTLLQNDAIPIACDWIMPLMVGKNFIGAVKMSDLLGLATMRDHLAPFFRYMALILNNEIKTRIAETANKAKSNFLATMSHEIRTPLNGMLGMAQLLTRNDITQEKQHEYANTILSSGQTLLAMLNDILDLSKIEASKLSLSYTLSSPQEIIMDVLLLFSESARQKNLEITAHWIHPKGQQYLIDPVRVRQMLTNLVSNAIKFTERGYVHIEGYEVNRTGQQAELEFSVSDSGIGIKLEQQRYLFEPFTQLDASSTRRYGGTGLGLSIVQRFAHLMQGSTGLESSPESGSRFWIRIKGSIGADTNPPMPVIHQTARTTVDAPLILVVDDNTINCAVLSKMLEMDGIKTISVSNGQDALAIFKTENINLIFMDCHMPVMDGYTVTRQIRAIEQEQQKARTPIIALTGSVFEEDRKLCLEAGMDDVIFKPLKYGGFNSEVQSPIIGY